jgi:kumamolisin
MAQICGWTGAIRRIIAIGNTLWEGGMKIGDPGCEPAAILRSGGRWIIARGRAIIAAALAASIAAGCAGGPGMNAVSANGEPVAHLAGNHATGVDLTMAKPAPENKTLEMEADFALRHQAQFDQLMDQINDRSSPKYHHWLTPEQMHARFGESQSEFNAVEQWLRAQGFAIIDKSYGTNADFIKFKGTIKQVEQAFQVRIVSPEYDTYANRDDPVIPAQFAGVISHIIGLDNVGAL